jgi:hypothetical protein
MPVWRTKKGTYSCSETWEVLREKLPTVSWWRTIWFSQAIPKHSFILWLVFWDALPTKDIMIFWGFVGNFICSFCHGCLESRDHLFFSCSFSSRVWKRVIATCFISNPRKEWEDIKGKSIWTTLCKVCLGASIYHLWRQRNDLLHGNVPRTEEQIIAHIPWEVKKKIMARCRIKDTATN